MNKKLEASFERLEKAIKEWFAEIDKLHKMSGELCKIIRS